MLSSTIPPPPSHVHGESGNITILGSYNSKNSDSTTVQTPDTPQPKTGDSAIHGLMYYPHYEKSFDSSQDGNYKSVAFESDSGRDTHDISFDSCTTAHTITSEKELISRL